MEGDDGRWYESEAAWEYAYNEGCKAELRAIYAAEMADEGDDFIGPVQPYKGSDEIPF
ncbi:MAG: hypothetical protein ACKO0Z_05030 [Betaproteobacteria bacterium]